MTEIVIGQKRAANNAAQIDAALPRPVSLSSNALSAKITRATQKYKNSPAPISKNIIKKPRLPA